MTLLATDILDQRIAEELLGEEFNPHFHRFTSEPECAEQLTEWLHERGIALTVSGNSVTLSRRRLRLFTVTADTPLLALAKAAVRLIGERL